MSGPSVGRISVGVMPDLTGFRKRLKEDLERVEKEVRGRVHVDVDLNAKGVSAKFDALMAELRAKGARGVDIDVDKGGKLAKSLGGIGSAFSAAGRSIRGSGAAQSIREFSEALRLHQSWLKQQDRSLTNNQARLRSYSTAVRESVASLKEHIQRLRETDMSLSANAARFRSWAQSTRTSIAQAASGFRGFFAELRNMRGDGGDGMSRAAASLDRLGRSARDVSAPIKIARRTFLGLTSTSWLVLAVAALLPPALALVSGALVGLPAVAAGVLAPIGAIALGLDGIKKAASVLAPSLTALKATMSAAFSSQLTPVFQELNKIFPTLQRSMPKVATGLADMAKAFVDTITSGPGMEKIDNIISSIGQALSRSAPGIASFTNGLLTLTGKVAAKFPGISDAFNRVGESFSRWVDKITAAGSDGQSPLDKAMKGFGNTLREIGGLITDLAKQGFDFLSDPNFGNSMKEFVSDIRVLTTSVLPELAQFFKDIVSSIKEISDAVSTAKKLTLGNPDKGSADQEKAKQDAIAKARQQAAAAGQPDPFADKSMWQSIKDELASLGGWITSWAKEMFFDVPLAMARLMWTQLASDVSASMSEIGSTISSAWSGLWSSVASETASAWAGITATGHEVWDGLVSTATSALTNLVSAITAAGASAVSEIGSWPGKFVAALGNLGSLLVSAGKDLIQGLINGIKSMAGAVADAAVSVASNAKNAVTSFLGIHSPSRVFHEIGQNVGQGFANGLDAEQQRIVDTAKAIMQAAKDVFGDKANLAFNFNLGGLQQQMGSVSDSVAGISRGVKDAYSGSRGMSKRLDQDAKAQLDQMKLQRDQLELERKKLQLEYDSTKDKAKRSALKEQMDQIKVQKDQLAIQSQQVRSTGQYSDEVGDVNKQFAGLLNKAAKLPYSFAEANGKQFLSDLGVSGNGAISNLLDQGLGIASNYVFNVSNIEQALQVKQNQQNKEAMQFAGR